MIINLKNVKMISISGANDNNSTFCRFRLYCYCSLFSFVRIGPI